MALGETRFTEDVLVADGDVLIIDDFTVFEGELRIEGGGLVQINPGDWTISIEGSLVIAGEENNPAEIRSVDGEWNGIDIDFGATASIAWAEIDASNSTTININSGPVTIENTTIADAPNLSNPASLRRAVRAQAGPISIDRCTFGPIVGSPGMPATTASGNGTDGGDVTAILMLNVNDVSITRSQFVGIRGGNGGAGDDGNNGQTGFPGSDAPPGSGLNGLQGQDGGDGFDGGNGGNGGDVVIVQLSSVENAMFAQNIVDRPQAGTGGRGGNGGGGGRGGRGGDGASDPIGDGGDGGRGGRGGDGGRGGIGGSSGEMSVVQYVAVGFQQTGSTVVAHNTVYQASSGQAGAAGQPGVRGFGGQGGSGGDGGIFGSDGSNGPTGAFGSTGQPGFPGLLLPSAVVRLDDVTLGGPGSGDARVHNNIFSPNPVSSLLGTTIAIDGTPAFTCDARSNVFSGFDFLAAGISPVGIGSVLTQAPLFENANASDFRPMIGSFLVDGGDNSVTPAGIEEDFFGNPRFMDEPSTPTTGPGGQFAVDFGAIERLGDTFGNDCLADVNNDGSVSPADFNAWVIAFNTNAPECDQNGDGLCTPADFNAWVLNFNAGCN